MTHTGEERKINQTNYFQKTKKKELIPSERKSNN